MSPIERRLRWALLIGSVVVTWAFLLSPAIRT